MRVFAKFSERLRSVSPFNIYLRRANGASDCETVSRFFVCVKVVRANKVAPVCLLCESKKAQKVCKIGKYAYLCTHKSHRGVEQLVARRAHNPEAGGSSPPPATKEDKSQGLSIFFCLFASAAYCVAFVA